MTQTTLSMQGAVAQPQGLSTVAAEAIEPVDLHVGAKIRDRRRAINMSQNELAGHLGVTFQQVQKYEKGTNRVSMSTMKRVSDALGKSVGWFIEDFPGSIPSMEDMAAFQQWLAGREGQRWMRLGFQLSDDAREAIWSVARVLRKHTTEG